MTVRYRRDLVCLLDRRRAMVQVQTPILRTHFLSMLNRVFNFELSSDLSDTYASGLDVVVVSAVDAIEVAGDGAGDALAPLEGRSPEEDEVMLTDWRLISVWRY